MKSECSSEIFTVPYEVFQLLDPVEKIVIRMQVERGEVKINEATESSVSKKVVPV